MTKTELKARAVYAWNCLFMIDGSWDMGAHLTGSIWPWGGVWVNERGTFNTLNEARQKEQTQ
jgi:hypothetical protein